MFLLKMPKREPFSDEEKIEADLLAEDVTGKAVNYGNTVKAIAALEKRIACLRDRAETFRKSEAAQGTVAHKRYLELLGEIRQAETDLANYRRLQAGRN